MQHKIPYIDRDISWLSFNYRVLQEAKDPNVPLLERLKFLAIYSSNLEEFFKVRMAYHRSLKRLGKKVIKSFQLEPVEVLEELKAIVHQQQLEFSEIFNRQIIPELKHYQIYLKHWRDLDDTQSSYIEEYFQEHMLPFVQPVLLNKQSIRPFLTNAALYLAVMLEKKESGKTKYAIVKVPSDYLPRFIELPSQDGHFDVIMLDDIVRYNISFLFPGYRILDSQSIKLTRDAELYIDDEHEGDLIEKIKEQLNRRSLGAATRFVIDREMPRDMLKHLSEAFNLVPEDIQEEGRYHNNFDFFGFPDFGMDHLHDSEMPSIRVPELERPGLHARLLQRDYLVHFPYQSYEPVIQFFEQAADDPMVREIKIIQYRVAKKSRIMDALLLAAKRGKSVTAFVEVKARFDEEANLRWAKRLEHAGVKVIYSFPGLKVHSKLGLVVREQGNEMQRFCYLSTGNFHEKTAELYSDLGLFTADKRITTEVERVFEFLETLQKPEESLAHLLVGQINLRASLERFVHREIEHAKAGRPAHIILKMNSLEDPRMVQLLYEASQAGVKIDLIVRGICCLIPQLKGWSENINAISILDRYLEHARIFYFLNDGEKAIYLSSADFMRRNLSRRIETSFPLYDPALKQEVIDFLHIQLQDNLKARVLDEARSNAYQKNDLPVTVRAQVEMYHYLKRKATEDDV